MDAESRATLDEAIDRLKLAGAAIVDRINAALLQTGAALIDRAIGQVSNVAKGVLESIAATESKAALDAQAIIGSLDGWTITITLHRPQEKPQ
jgi:hypothetical protein